MAKTRAYGADCVLLAAFAAVLILERKGIPKASKV
jgi:hypothetical protein